MPDPTKFDDQQPTSGIIEKLRKLDPGMLATLEGGAPSLTPKWETMSSIDESSFPRRGRINLLTAGEIEILDALSAVEKLGADVRLTRAVFLLQEARDLVADVIDERLGLLLPVGRQTREQFEAALRQPDPLRG